MIRSLLLLITISLITSSGFSQKKNAKAPGNFTIESLAPGVWAAIHNDQFGKAICNAGIVDLGNKTLIFDPFMTPSAAEELQTIAMELTGRPVTIVINSHYHNDHIRGNQVFPPYATIISTAWTRDQIVKAEPEEQKWERRHAPALLKAARKMYASSSGFDREELPLWIGYYEGIMESMDDLKTKLPDVVFTDSLWIIGTKRSVKLVEFKNGHTESDAVLFLPAEKIAFTGDLLFVNRHPWIADGDPINWEATLEKIFNDPNMDTFVPGHGPVCDKNPIKELQGYLTKMQELASTADNDSLQSKLLVQPIPSPYNNWYFNKFYEPNMKFLFTRNKNSTAIKK